MAASHHEGEQENDGEHYVPEGVVEGIEDIVEGRTASKEDIASVLKF